MQGEGRCEGSLAVEVVGGCHVQKPTCLMLKVLGIKV